MNNEANDPDVVTSALFSARSNSASAREEIERVAQERAEGKNRAVAAALERAARRNAAQFQVTPPSKT